MKRATFGTLAIAAVIGCAMLFYADWWIIPIGIAIGIFALAYSAGPYPLSHHGLGDVAVILFFGVVPVTLTCYLQQGNWNSITTSLPTSVAIGLLAANVLIVNNYRDMDDDKAVGKNTTVVIFGRNTMRWYYLLSGIAGMVVMFPVWKILPLYSIATPLLYLVLHFRTWQKIGRSQDIALNPLLGETARNLLILTLLFLGSAIMA
jgi:1,4-dihydroxy-2-naphthoate octaprenyltransferase